MSIDEYMWGITIQTSLIEHALQHNNWYSTEQCPYKEELINWSCSKALKVVLEENNVSDIVKRHYSNIWGHIDLSKIDNTKFGGNLIRW